MVQNSISVIPVKDKKQLKQFLAFPYDLYRGEENWRPPLRFERGEQINPKKNPGLDGLEIQHFLALQGGKVVGRVSAIINASHLEQYRDSTGHFGFFDVESDPKIAEALMAVVEQWLKDRGMTRVLGPFNLGINEEIGILIDGFDSPNVMLMPHGHKDYPTTLEGMGFRKAKDVIAFWANMHEGYPRPKIVNLMLKLFEKTKEATLRPMKSGKLLSEVEVAIDIFNDAWSENWGFIPFSKAQVKHMATELKPIMMKDFFWFCEYEGKPAAFILMLPNLNEAAEGLDGKLLPFGWAKLLYRIKVKGLKSARIPLMGVSKEFRGTRLGTAMAAVLSEKAFEMGRKHGYTHVEMSWILEDNQSMIRIIEQAKGVPYKTYRMYEKPIK